MSDFIFSIAEKLVEEHSLSSCEYEELIKGRSKSVAEYLRKSADNVRKKYYGNTVYVRGLIEISNICKNNCYYCGIRSANSNCERYRLTSREIFDCCVEGYSLGLRTFVLQGGEDSFYTDEVLCDLIFQIKECFPDCAVTLSLGERSRGSYQALYEAGADRYLLRHEAADGKLYSELHPSKMSLANRMECLKNLKEIGYQVGCGFMVGAPYQTPEHIAKDLKFIEEFKPDMCGIGPFIPHKDTAFKHEKAGSSELTCFLLSVVRLIHPRVLLPSTTALNTVDANGREKGILSGANVVMPNLSPVNVRRKYSLYDNKLSTGSEGAQQRRLLEKEMEGIGYRIVTHRGDIEKENNTERNF